MGRKRNPVLPVFTRDILSSPRCRALSEQAAGVYFFLLCRLNEPPQPGAYRISDWELHPNWRRSKTQQCLATADKYERLPYFAAMLAKNDLPWRQKNILAGLQELYKYGIIVVEGDMLVQPRMYKDNGFTLPDLDRDGDPESTIADDQDSGSMAVVEGSELRGKKGVQKQVQKSAEISTEKGTEKVHEKAPVSHAGASRKEIEIENNNNSIGSSIGGVGENLREGEKTVVQKPSRFTPPTQEEVTAYCQEKGYTFDPIQFWNHYEANGWVQGRNKPIKNWKACCVTWQQRENNGEFRSHSNNNNAEATTRHTGNTAATARRAATGDGQHPTDDELREQSMRIIERKLRKDDGDSA